LSETRELIKTVVKIKIGKVRTT